ncbi:MAG TPA: transglycosylase SLT domain-containing protein [Gemmatimonadaceae bacterium]
MSTPTPDRRHRSDRRAEPAPARRAPKPSPWVRWLGIAGRDILIILGTITAIVFALWATNPIFTNSPRVVTAVTRTSPTAAKVLASTRQPPRPVTRDTTRRGQVVQTPEFERDRKAFAEALVKTRRVPQARADSISYYAVREAYINGIPPAVVFGVMLTENAQFVSGAMSNVGAVGLMQVYPRIWLKVLRGRFGEDLAIDSTNIKYGTYILREYIKSDAGAVTAGNLVRGLLRYNGCVLGRNTPNCRNYPAKVKNYVEEAGDSICGDRSFYDCIARPFLTGLFGRREEMAD